MYLFDGRMLQITEKECETMEVVSFESQETQNEVVR